MFAAIIARAGTCKVSAIPPSVCPGLTRMERPGAEGSPATAGTLGRCGTLVVTGTGPEGACVQAVNRPPEATRTAPRPVLAISPSWKSSRLPSNPNCRWRAESRSYSLTSAPPRVVTSAEGHASGLPALEQRVHPKTMPRSRPKTRLEHWRE